MTPGMYQLTHALMALISEQGHLAAHKIPAGELIEVEAQQRIVGARFRRPASSRA